MLSYDIDEAIELLTDKLATARKNLELAHADLGFLRDQITTMEVNTARVHNWDVKRRREQCVACPLTQTRSQRAGRVDRLHSPYTLRRPSGGRLPSDMWRRFPSTARATAAVAAPTARAPSSAWALVPVRYASGPPRARSERPSGGKNQGRRTGSGGGAPARAVPSAKNWARDTSRAARPAPAAKEAPRKAPAPRTPPRPKNQTLALPPVLSVFHLARMLNVHMRTFPLLTRRQAAVPYGADWL